MEAFMIALPLLLLLLSQDTFEAASIRPANAQNNSSGFTTSRGGIRTENTSLAALIRFAYKAHSFQVLGATGWMEDLRWDINARNPDGDTASGSEEQKRTLAKMQNLLAERFQLKIREETRDLPVYALVVDKPGHKLKSSERTNRGSTTTNEKNGSGSINSDGIAMKDFVLNLSGMTGRTVIDETGLGDMLYRIELRWSEGGSGDGPSIFTAIREQLGLRLESKKGPVAVYVIERAEKPSEN
jgi:uncharacterized protein (TIGR03435 family)